MKKFTSTDLGGAPIYKNDLRDIFNSEIWEVIQAMLSPFNSDVEGLVITGCVTTNNAGNFDMTSGIVYLNGEFMRIAAVTNQAFTKYIAPSAVVNDSRTFQDSSVNIVAVTKGAGLVGSAPGSGQYLTISSLTDLDNRRWKPMQSETDNLRTKVINIGDWDMNASATVTVNHGLTLAKIRSVSAIIRNDADTIYSVVGAAVANTGAPEVYFVSNNAGPGNINSTSLLMGRLASGTYDSTNYDQTSYNRGWITITYEV